MGAIGVVLIVLAAIMAIGIGIGIGLPLYMTIQGIWRNGHLPRAV